MLALTFQFQLIGSRYLQIPGPCPILGSCRQPPGWPVFRRKTSGTCEPFTWLGQTKWRISNAPLEILIGKFSNEPLERELEDGLLAHIRKFLIELGAGFAFVGQQVHLAVDGEDFCFDAGRSGALHHEANGVAPSAAQGFAAESGSDRGGTKISR